MSLVKRILTYVFPRRPVLQSGAKVRILIQGMNYAPEMIGVGKYTSELARFLAGRGHRVEAIVAQPHYPGFVLHAGRSNLYARSQDDGVSIVRCPLLLRNAGRGIWRFVAPLSFAVAAAPILVWRSLRFRPHVILCIEPALMAAPVAMVMAKLCRARLVLHVQDLEIDAAFATGFLRGRMIRAVATRLERALLVQSDAVVTISDAMAVRLANKGVEPRRLTVLRNWIDRAALRRSQGVGYYRQTLGFRPSDRVVLYSGNLGAKQGLATLLDAAKRIPPSAHLRVVIVGEGPMADLVDAAVAGHPSLLRLPLQPAHLIGDLLDLADVHVLPQDARAADLVFPSKLGPMLASGRPVVVTASRGTELAEWLRGAALLVEPGDPEALASALLRALETPAGIDPAQTAARVSALDSTTILPAFESTLLGLVEPATSPTLQAGESQAWGTGRDEVFVPLSG